MKVYAISDLHLSKAVNKPMYIFGESWSNYWELICKDWKEKVTNEDIVLVAGDISWGTYFDEAKPDIEAISALPGKIVIGKGNHDYWWSSLGKMKEFLPKNIFPLYNNCLRFDNVLICGSRLWSMGANCTEADKKILNHESLRLSLSLDAMEKERKEGDVVIAMTHFPPFDIQTKNYTFPKIFEEHGVNKVVYGHLHGDMYKGAVYREINGIPYYLTACDQVKNQLVEIL